MERNRNKKWTGRNGGFTVLGAVFALVCALMGSAHAATFVVDEPTDNNLSACTSASSDCTLRGAITKANAQAGDDVIVYDMGYTISAATLFLSGPLPTINGNLVIQGPGANVQTIRRNTAAAYNIFTVGQVVCSISGFTMSNGSLFDVDGLAGGGGGLWNLGELTLTDCTISGNSAKYGGGIENNGTLLMERCTLSGNTAELGGGIMSANPTTMRNCTLSGNTAEIGGGLFSGQSYASVHHCTITGNTAPPDCGSGIGSRGESIANTQVWHSIVAGNVNSDVDLVFGSSYNSFDSRGYNLIGTGSATGDFVNNDRINVRNPGLGPLANNGGATSTHAPLTGSPALDSGDPAFAAPPVTDQRGSVRVAHGHIDIGAVEIDRAQSGPTLRVNRIDDHSDNNCGLEDCTLREAIEAANALKGDNAIVFEPAVRGTIQLTGYLPELSSAIDLRGPGANLLTVRRNADKQFRIFAIVAAKAAISGLTIANGSESTGQGGGILVSVTSTLSLQNCVVSGNSANSGGGIMNNGGQLTVQNCTFSGNSSVSNGGAIHNGKMMTLLNSTVENNTAGYQGGGIFSMTNGISADNHTLIRNCTVSGNGGPAVKGGGLYIAFGIVTIESSTIAFNQGTRGSGICCQSSTVTQAELRHCIVSANANSDIDFELGNSNIFVSNGYNLIGNGNATANFTNHDLVGVRDPKIGPLAFNGGPTRTHSLQAGSPAIEAGDPAFVAPPATDQRGAGYPRVLGARIDIGAYEAPVRLSIDNVTVQEGAPGGTVAATFTVSLAAPTAQPVTVQYATASPSGSAASAGSDYVAVPATTLTFAPGETAKQITVLVNGDSLDEVNERFFVNLSGAVNAVIEDKEGVCTILDDDATPSLSIDDLTQSEGNSGTTAFTFNVTLSAPSGQNVNVKYATANPAANAATAGVDYVAVPPTTLTFAPGETSKPVTMLVNGDTAVEAAERFLVKLSAATNATIADSEGFGTITNDDVVGLLAPFEDTPSG